MKNIKDTPLIKEVTGRRRDLVLVIGKRMVLMKQMTMTMDAHQAGIQNT
jgi:hypothetical protein